MALFSDWLTKCMKIEFPQAPTGYLQHITRVFAAALPRHSVLVPVIALISFILIFHFLTCLPYHTMTSRKKALCYG